MVFNLIALTLSEEPEVALSAGLYCHKTIQ